MLDIEHWENKSDVLDFVHSLLAMGAQTM